MVQVQDGDVQDETHADFDLHGRRWRSVPYRFEEVSRNYICQWASLLLQNENRFLGSAAVVGESQTTLETGIKERRKGRKKGDVGFKQGLRAQTLGNAGGGYNGET